MNKGNADAHYKARRQALARVKAHLKKVQKLPKHNPPKCKKKSKKITTSRPAWNDRFFAEEELEPDNENRRKVLRDYKHVSNDKSKRRCSPGETITISTKDQLDPSML